MSTTQIAPKLRTVRAARPERGAGGRRVPCSLKQARVAIVGYGSGVWELAHALRQRGVTVAGLATTVSAQAEAHEPSYAYLRSQGLYRSVQETAQALDVPMLETQDPNTAEAVATVTRRWGAHAVISYSAPILKRSFIAGFDGWVFNLHGSAAGTIYRGRGGPSWMLLHGVRQGQVLWHWVDTGVDSGDLVFTRRLAWGAHAYPVDIMRGTVEQCAPMTERFCALWAGGAMPARAQHAARVRYFPSLNTSLDGFLHWDWTPEQAERCIRAFGWPYAGAAGHYASQARQVQLARIARASVVAKPARGAHPLANGIVTNYGPNGSVDIVCGGGILRAHTLRDGVGEAPADGVLRKGGRFVASPAGASA